MGSLGAYERGISTSQGGVRSDLYGKTNAEMAAVDG
jgi:hypothetical protein